MDKRDLAKRAIEAFDEILEAYESRVPCGCNPYASAVESIRKIHADEIAAVLEALNSVGASA